MYRYALTGFAIALILGAGYVHGTVTQRWQPSEHLSVAASRLKTLPTTVGDWDSKDIEMNKKHLQVAEVEGYVSRQYYNKKTGERLSFLLICGKPGPFQCIHLMSVTKALATRWVHATHKLSRLAINNKFSGQPASPKNRILLLCRSHGPGVMVANSSLLTIRG